MADLEKVVVLRGLEIPLVGMAMGIATYLLQEEGEGHFLSNLENFGKEAYGNPDMVNGIMAKCAEATKGLPEWEVDMDEKFNEWLRNKPKDG